MCSKWTYQHSCLYIDHKYCMYSFILILIWYNWYFPKRTERDPILLSYLWPVPKKILTPACLKTLLCFWHFSSRVFYNWSCNTLSLFKIRKDYMKWVMCARWKYLWYIERPKREEEKFKIVDEDRQICDVVIIFCHTGEKRQ